MLAARTTSLSPGALRLDLPQPELPKTQTKQTYFPSSHRPIFIMPPTWMPTTPPHYEYRDEFGRRRSATASDHGGGSVSKSNPNILSPPPSPQISRGRTPRSPINSSFTQRLRSNSGLSLHMNEDALRQYTDYNADGTSKGPLFRPFSWQSRDGDSATGPPRRGLVSDEHDWNLPIPDVFGVEIFQMVLKDPSAASGLLKFSREAGYGVDMAYLSKVSKARGPHVRHTDRGSNAPAC